MRWRASAPVALALIVLLAVTQFADAKPMLRGLFETGVELLNQAAGIERVHVDLPGDDAAADE